jgi:hypothetical protein
MQIIKNGFEILEGDYAGKFGKRLEDGVDQKVRSQPGMAGRVYAPLPTLRA